MKIWLPTIAGLAAILAAGVVSSGSTAGPGGGKRLSSYDGEARALLARMTLAEKVGQMTQAEQDKLENETDIETLFLGPLLSGGNSDPKPNSPPDWTDTHHRSQAHAPTP